ncbi:MAG: DUF5050 domain-containing protein [Ignavibacteriaceae bacterium]
MKKLLIILSVLILLILNSCKSDIVNPIPVDSEKIIFVSTSDLSDPNSVTNIFSINLDGRNLKQLTSGSNYYSNYPVTSFDGSKIIFQADKDGNPDIFSINIDGSNLINLTNSPHYDFSPQISKDNNIIVFKSYGLVNGWLQNSQIFRMNIDGSNPTNLTNDSLYTHVPLISPNSDIIYFIAYINGNARIFSMTINGENKKAITDSTLDVSTLENDYTISSEGSQIAFIAFNQTTQQTDLYIINIDGTGLKNLTANSESEANPAFSKDNLQIAYDIKGHSGLSEKQPIKIISTSGGTPEILIEMEKAAYPVFNLTGEKILFTAENNGYYDIYSIDRNGNNLFNITNRKADDFFPRILH